MAVRDIRGFTLLEILFVVLISMTVAAIAIPMSGNALGYFRLSGDARAVSNGIAVTKMRAASDFTRARLYVDSAGAHHLETFIKPNAPGSTCATPALGCWQRPLNSNDTILSQGVTLGFQSLATDPRGASPPVPSPNCLDDAGAAIAGTSCVIFNSRGVPVDVTGAPVANNAIYLTDNTAVYGITVEASGLVRLWRSGPSVAQWVRQ